MDAVLLSDIEVTWRAFAVEKRARRTSLLGYCVCSGTGHLLMLFLAIGTMPPALRQWSMSWLGM